MPDIAKKLDDIMPLNVPPPNKNPAPESKSLAQMSQNIHSVSPSLLKIIKCINVF